MRVAAIQSDSVPEGRSLRRLTTFSVCGPGAVAVTFHASPSATTVKSRASVKPWWLSVAGITR